MTALPERLRALREKRGMTQRELADAIGVSRQAIGFYESGEREPDLTTIQKLAHALGTSVSYLVGETDDPSPPPTVAAAHQGAAGMPFTPEEQLIIERAIRNAFKELEDLRRRRQVRGEKKEEG